MIDTPGNQFRTESERTVRLTFLETEVILRSDPSFRSVSKSAYFDNYDLPCPVRVTLETNSGEKRVVVLRKARHGDIEKEVEILRALEEFGLPVPEVLTGPFQNENGERAAVYSLLPGENLQKFSMRSPEGLQKVKLLLIEAVIRLSEASDFMARHKISAFIPRHSLSYRLETLQTASSDWIDEEIFQRALKRLEAVFSEIKTPLVFSNGDYQPGNFLTQDGEITGFLDFESVSFQDPLMGFVKYPIYELQPLSETDVVSKFLELAGFSEQDFASRLALGCLQTLQKEIPVSGGDQETDTYRTHVLGLLEESLSKLTS